MVLHVLYAAEMAASQIVVFERNTADGTLKRLEEVPCPGQSETPSPRTLMGASSTLITGLRGNPFVASRCSDLNL